MELSDVERVALNYCAPRGIPLSVFFGRVVVSGAPQWLERDAAAALWWQAEEDRRCSNCGRDLNVTLDPETERLWEAEAIWCHGCRAVHRAGLKLAKKDPYLDADPLAGSRFRFTETPTPVEV